MSRRDRLNAIKAIDHVKIVDRGPALSAISLSLKGEGNILFTKTKAGHHGGNRSSVSLLSCAGSDQHSTARLIWRVALSYERHYPASWRGSYIRAAVWFVHIDGLALARRSFRDNQLSLKVRRGGL